MAPALAYPFAGLTDDLLENILQRVPQQWWWPVKDDVSNKEWGLSSVCKRWEGRLQALKRKERLLFQCMNSRGLAAVAEGAFDEEGTKLTLQLLPGKTRHLADDNDYFSLISGGKLTLVRQMHSFALSPCSHMTWRRRRTGLRCRGLAGTGGALICPPLRSASPCPKASDHIGSCSCKRQQTTGHM